MKRVAGGSRDEYIGLCWDACKIHVSYVSVCGEPSYKP